MQYLQRRRRDCVRSVRCRQSNSLARDGALREEAARGCASDNAGREEDERMTGIDLLRFVGLGFVLVLIFLLGVWFWSSVRPIFHSKAYRRLKEHCAAVIDAYQREVTEKQARIDELEYQLTLAKGRQ